jgi:hypothetical protein
MRDIAVTSLVLINDRHENGNILLASFDFKLCDLVEFFGATLLQYRTGKLTTFVPKTMTRDGEVVGARFADQDLRNEIATAALSAYRKMGGKLAGDEPAPSMPLAASITELPTHADGSNELTQGMLLPRPRGLRRWLDANEVKAEKASRDGAR